MGDERACFICNGVEASGAPSADDLAVAVPFRAPMFPGHTVVAPAAHHDLEDVTGAEWLAIGQAARRISRRSCSQDPDIEKCYLVAIGDVDRGHLHFHVVPKRKSAPSLGPFVFGESGWLGCQDFEGLRANRHAPLKTAHDLAAEWLDGLDTRPVEATASLQELRTRFVAPMPIEGTDPVEVVRDLAMNMRDGLLGSAGGRFFAWVIGGGTEAALAADWLVSAWDQNAALYACSPAAAVVEQQAGEWLKELLDLPRDASFAFTTGCQLAHMTSLAAARHSVLERFGWNVEQAGLAGAPAVKVIVNDQKHGSIRQSVSFLGLGQASLVEVATLGTGRMTVEGLREALEGHEGPKIVVMNAADLNIGAFDDYKTLIPLAREHGAWVHIDGAFGLFARVSDTYSPLTAGIELADSWATDGHKWLNVPFDCGVAIIRDRVAHKASMTISAPYVASADNARDQIDWNPEWSRRARGVPVYAVLREMGRKGVADMVDRCCLHCAAIVEGIGRLPGAEIVSKPILNQGLLRFRREGMDADAADAYTLEVMRGINSTGEAFFSDTLWQGRRAMRVSVVSWRTSQDDVQRAIEAAGQVLRRTLT